jgi:hypothetical protein
VSENPMVPLVAARWVPLVAAAGERMIDVLSRGWCRYDLAQEGEWSRPVSPASPEAAQWCLIGAWRRVEDELSAVHFILDPPTAHGDAAWANANTALTLLYNRMQAVAFEAEAAGVADYNDRWCSDGTDAISFVRQAIAQATGKEVA